jgi:ABC-type antimicrobial peptide transport system permease subunit
MSTLQQHPPLALIIWLAGGLLPAFRAARMNIVEALRAA